MPLDDLRPSLREPVAAPPEEASEVVLFDEDGPPLTPEEEAAHLEAWMEVARQELADVRAGRVVALPWDEAMNERIFGKLR